MALCCAFLDNLLTGMGNRGFSAVLKSEMGLTFFCLQSRAVDATEAEQLAKTISKSVDGLTGKIRLTEQIALTYCPSCGCKLESWMADHPREVDELVRRSRPFVL